MIEISDEVREVLLKKMKDAKGHDKHLKIEIFGYGWAGPVFGIAQAEQKDEDVTFDLEGLEILVDKTIIDMHEAFNIDLTGHIMKRITVTPKVNKDLC